jgi:hypothetical protein
MFSSKTKTVTSTRFSEFIRKASSGEKKKVYDQVLKKATERQRRVLASVPRAKGATSKP